MNQSERGQTAAQGRLASEDRAPSPRAKDVLEVCVLRPGVGADRVPYANRPVYTFVLSVASSVHRPLSPRPGAARLALIVSLSVALIAV